MDGPADPSRVPSLESRGRLLTLIRGYRISQAIYVASRLGIPDLPADGPREIDELADATGSHLAQTISLGRLEETMGHHLIEAQPA